MARLPLELTDMIVDYLHRDYRSLIQCSVVSKALLPASRYHLFNRVNLRNASVVSFVDLLASPLSTINGHIRFVVISGTRLQRFDLNNVQRIFALPAVRTLFLHSLNWHTLPEGTRTFLLAGLPKLVTLKLWLVSNLPVFSQFLGFLRACSSLQTLDVACIEYDKMTSSVIPPRSNIRLRRLEIASGPPYKFNNAQMLRGLLVLPNVCHLESFKYMYLRHQEMPQVWDFMQLLKPVLRDFVVSFADESQKLFLQTFRLNDFTELQSIDFPINTTKLVDFNEFLVPVLGILPRSIRRMRIHLSISTIGEIKHVDWPALIALFATSQFPTLQQVQILVGRRSLTRARGEETKVKLARTRLAKCGAPSLFVVSRASDFDPPNLIICTQT